MNLSSIIITYNSQNYTASAPNNQLTIGIVGGLILSSSATAGTVIDITPTILIYNTSTSSTTPTFVMVPSARAYVVPQNHLSQSVLQVGHKEDDSNNTWLTQDITNQYHQSSFNITSASLSNKSLSVTVNNTGNTSVFIQSIYIGPNVSQSGDHTEGSDFASTVFTVLANGTLVPFGTSDSGNQQNIGYNLSAKSHVTFEYSGQIPPAFNYTKSSTGDNIQQQSSDMGQLVQGANDETSTPTSTTTTIESTTTHSTTVESSSSHAIQIVSGQSYIIGVTSGDRTLTTIVSAS